jgi:tagatose-1,6-bisphosphate aldolase
MKLPALKNPAGVYGLVALDEAYALGELIGLSLQEPSHEAILQSLLSQLIAVCSLQASGLVFDPVYTLPLLDKKADQVGTVVRLEQSVPADPLILPKLPQNWGVENVRNVYGVAKLELYYHPSEATAVEKKKLVAEIFDFCQYEKIDFLLKLIIYHPAKQSLTTEQFQAAQLEAVSDFQRFADILAVQYPQDPLAAATLTSELDIPWLMVDDEIKYDKFKDQVRVAMENGAQGFLVDEALWHELGELRLKDHSPDLPAIEKFIQTTVKDRIIELMRIAGEEKS